MLRTLEGIEQAEARRVRECVPAGPATGASAATSAAPAVRTAAPAFAPAPMVVVPQSVAVLVGVVVGAPGMLPRPVPVTPVPVPVIAAVPLVALLTEVLGTSLQPPALLVSAHRHQGLLDQRDRVVRGRPLGFRP
ncbi:hypothetical protein [Agromyces cerinus]|uniref:hypothetical protein n=1 Tax=Agromyces cerinus TaxID=33878 RepID=UPI001F41DFE4|nr:hypothetical protein [Agromyces cerinus]